MHIEVVSITVVPYYTVITRDVPVERDCNTITVLLLLLFQINNQSIKQDTGGRDSKEEIARSNADKPVVSASKGIYIHYESYVAIFDLCFCNIKGAYNKCYKKDPLGISDHSNILLLPTYLCKLKTEKPVKRLVKQWECDSTEQLHNCLDTTDWNILYSDDVNECVETVSFSSVRTILYLLKK